MEYKRNLYPGIVLTIFSTLFLMLSSQIKKFSGLGADPLGARAVPYLWGASLLILSLILIIRGMRQRTEAIQKGTYANVKLDVIQKIKENREIILTFIALSVYVALLEPIGFLIMTTVYLFLQTLILTAKEKRRYVLTLITSIVVAVALDYIFVCLLRVLLPPGIFGF